MHTLNDNSQDCLCKNKMMFRQNITLKKRNTLKKLVSRLFWNIKIDQKKLRETLEITFWK